MSKSAGMIQAYEIRDFAADAARELRKTPARTIDEQVSRAQALKALTGTWRDAVDRLRIMRGKPLPGSLRPEKRVKPRKAAAYDESGPVAQTPTDPPPKVEVPPVSPSGDKTN